MDESICELESEKATNELPAEKSGYLHPVAREGEVLKIGDVLATLTVDETAPVKKDVVIPQLFPEEGKEENNGSKNIALPAAGKLMRETGVEVQEGSGLGGRIIKEDVWKAVEKKKEIPVNSFSRQERREKLTSLRKTIARHLVEAKNTTAMLTTFNEVDMKAIMDLRAKYKEEFQKKHEISLGFMGFFTRAVCLALQQFPAVNGRIEKDEIVYHEYCDVAIAVSTPKGLVTPVIRNAESLSLAEIERQVATLAGKGRENKLSMEEMSGGTFTISNGGVFGSLMSTPIINIPQSAILGMHKIQERVVVLGGKMEIRPMMYVALSYDHRIVDGKESVTFLVKVKEMLENPALLLSGNDPVKEFMEL
jgi:2-oxoglutarate dehydrogenase E2 component (dihydrolipoamide succinyltransferase)